MKLSLVARLFWYGNVGMLLLPDDEEFYTTKVPSLTLGACARVTVVVLCVCLSVTTLAATYLVYESKLLCYKVPYGVPNA